LADIASALLVLILIGLGGLMTCPALGESRAQQLAEARFAERQPQVVLAAPNAARIVPVAAHDRQFARRMAGEAVGFVLVLTVAIACRFPRRRRPPVQAETRWITTAPPRAPASAMAEATPPHRDIRDRAAPGSVAADRLSVVVWSDNVVRHESAHG
jgi:hypothetical protein